MSSYCQEIKRRHPNQQLISPSLNTLWLPHSPSPLVPTEDEKMVYKDMVSLFKKRLSYVLKQPGTAGFGKRHSNIDKLFVFLLGTGFSCGLIHKLVCSWVRSAPGQCTHIVTKWMCFHFHASQNEELHFVLAVGLRVKWLNAILILLYAWLINLCLPCKCYWISFRMKHDLYGNYRVQSIEEIYKW